MSFRWVITQPEHAEAISNLMEVLNVPESIARLLAIRGISSFEDAKQFFRPTLNELHDPFLMKDMDRASERLSLAIRTNEKVLVYGDYDVDGTTATAIMYSFLKEFGVEVDYYIPHRFKEGYGINPEGIQYAHEIGANVIVSVDCGITAIEEAVEIKSLGMDLIICDHHTVGEQLPDAFAILDPKREDCGYPFDGLSGAGVGFKLVQATLARLGLPAQVAYKYLDLLAISIASDIVPIIDENRILMWAGLDWLRTEPRIGIQALMNLIRLPHSELDTKKIVFSIGPRINAAGRMGDASAAVRLLIASDELEAKLMARELEGINAKRRDTDTTTMNEAVQQIEEQLNMDRISALVLFDANWHLGVIGIVASRLVDQYHRPAIMLSEVDGKIKGSARSIRGFNIYEAIRECEDLLEQFGGHEYAAGLTLKDGALQEFQKRMNSKAIEELSGSSFEAELLVDAELQLSDIDGKFWKLLHQFQPFGPANTKPIFVSNGLKVAGVPSIVGNGHLKLRVQQGDSPVFDAIGFNMHEFMPKVRDGKLFNIAYELEENTWNGNTALQLHLRDIQET
ncbi:MAG: single-stranded-DNA-specific exonuclease RecJ [Bacteroidota bacterium]